MQMSSILCSSKCIKYIKISSVEVGYANCFSHNINHLFKLQCYLHTTYNSLKKNISFHVVCNTISISSNNYCKCLIFVKRKHQFSKVS